MISNDRFGIKTATRRLGQGFVAVIIVVVTP